ncbi:hypothetical protein SPI_08400 [Niveomyces insectorum RCEF 264]|uniref:Uncharacterized protein n=1 Tax=Niveomyces insectorum RCEF 264 TaxID=1081102 RepID=A0A162ICT9_9HYPO|nr:hypothetical protein SPI_08400 [Niveomyces insectorum RCEF 264]
MDLTAPHNKLTKAKGKMVKPILKKRSNSEKNSLDLDRPWEEQQVPVLGGWNNPLYESAGAGRSARDVSFALTDSTAFPIKTRFQHGRSPSGNSHISVATTASGGGTRPPGAFVHPFHQTPRTQTSPLLASANTVASIDNPNHNTFGNNHTATSSIRDYSPTITENEDDDDYPVGSLPTARYHHSHTASLSQSSLRHPSSHVAQRAASFSDINAAPPLRLNTARSMPGGPSARRGLGSSSLSSSLSQSDLRLDASAGGATFDSPVFAGPSASSSFVPSPHLGGASASPVIGGGDSGPHATLSPLRSSFDGVGFPRLRSRSELDAGARAEQIREARRKFEERERAKAEKHEREMLRKRERRDNREAKEMERQAAAQLRKDSGAGSDTMRPSLSRKTTPTFGSSSAAGGDLEKGRDSGRFRRQPPDITEKPLAFKSSKYDNMAGGTTPSFGPSVDNVAFKNARRNNSAKRKTQGYWTGFVLWLRTRLFRLGRK